MSLFTMSCSNLTIILCLLLLMLSRDRVEAILGSLRRGNRQCQRFTSRKITKSGGCDCIGIKNLFFAACKLNNINHCFNDNITSMCQKNVEYLGSYNSRNGYSQFVYNITEIMSTTKSVIDNNKKTLSVKVLHNNDFRISDGFLGFGAQNDNLQFINCTATIGNSTCQSCTVCDEPLLQYQFDCKNIPLSSSSNDVIYTKQCIGL